MPSRYLQFGFNLSLVLLFLYLVVQFIVTVQRDVEQRISEYSMGTLFLVCSASKTNHSIRHSTGNFYLRIAV